MKRILLASTLLASPAMAQQHVGALQTQNGLSEIAAGGAAARAAAQANLATVTCSSTTDNLPAFVAAFATGAKAITVAAGAGATCPVSGALVPQSGQTIAGQGGVPIIALVSATKSRILDLTGKSNVTFRDVIFDGTGATAGSDFVRFYNTSVAMLNNVTVQNAAGSNSCILFAQTSTNITIQGGSVLNCTGTAILANNANVAHIHINNTYITGHTGFGIRFMSGAHDSEINGAHCVGVPGVTTAECYAISLGSHDILINGAHGEYAGDNCISIVGDHNVVTGGTFHGCQKAGVYMWGSQNTVTGANFRDNNQAVQGWPCIGVNGNYGAAGQYNTATGNTCDDDQATPTQLGVVLAASSYTAWASGQAVTNGQQKYYGLNIYYASGAGITGATPPTCTSGTCYDGAVTWVYQSAFLTTAASGYNTMVGNQVIRYAGTAPYTDNTYGQLNTIYASGQASLNGPLTVNLDPTADRSQSYTSAAGLAFFGGSAQNPGIVFDSTNPSYTGAITWGYNGTYLQGRIEYLAAGAVMGIYTGGAKQIGISSTGLIPYTDNAIALGHATNRWSSVDSMSFLIADATAIDANGHYIQKLAAAPSTGPGAGQVRLFALTGTAGGTCKLVVQGGTTATVTLLLDNIGPGC